MAVPKIPPTMPPTIAPTFVLDPLFPLEEGLVGPAPVDVVREPESVSLGNGEDVVVLNSVVDVVGLRDYDLFSFNPKTERVTPYRPRLY